MPKTALCSLLVGLCLVPASTSVALAATPPSQPPSASASSTTQAPASIVTPVLDHLTIRYSASSATAEVLYTGATPGDSFELTNRETGDSGRGGTVRDVGRIVDSVSITPGALNHLELIVWNRQGHEISVPVEADDRREGFGAPGVDVRENAATGHAEVTVTGTPGAFVAIRQGRTGIVAFGQLSEATRTFDLPLPKEKTTYSVVQRKNLVESPTRDFTLSAISPDLPPAAPAAAIETIDGARALLVVRGEAGAILRITDAEGRLVGVKMMPASGGTQVWAPLTSAASQVELAVTRGAKQSAPTTVELPAAR